MRSAGRKQLTLLKQRSDFLKAARASKAVAAGLVLQMRRRSSDGRSPGETDEPRIGFTSSKKVGGAVQRNLARRRLRAAAVDVLVPRAKPLTDYVLIARGATLTRPYDALLEDLESALSRVERPRKQLKQGAGS